ncbi:MAG: FHA domain-containing protein [Chloroflexi bacterium OLB15]|nr:MAG: FHA domain-containing protein [Chloroflexi bacterium OLB15]
MIDCPNCHRKISPATKICPYCGELILMQNATRALTNADDEDTVPRWGTARLTGKMSLVLRVRGNDKKRFVFDHSEITELALGRKNPDTGEVPEIDLEESGAVEQGVSRRHAHIFRKETASLYVEDLGSPNGTYLNGQKLIANQPRILRDGDELRLGRLVLLVFFERV